MGSGVWEPIKHLLRVLCVDEYMNYDDSGFSSHLNTIYIEVGSIAVGDRMLLRMQDLYFAQICILPKSNHFCPDLKFCSSFLKSNQFTGLQRYWLVVSKSAQQRGRTKE